MKAKKRRIRLAKKQDAHDKFINSHPNWAKCFTRPGSLKK